MRRSRIRASAAAVVALTFLSTACTSSGGSNTGRSPFPEPSGTAQAVVRPPAGTKSAAAVWRAWGLKPLPHAPQPPAGPVVRLAGSGAVPVISRVPTKDKVVFITIDDGAEKDPKFVRMMRELKVPFTMFLTDAAIKDDYSYFKPLQQLGNTIQNHTLTHPNMPALGVAAQRAQVCGQQGKLTKEYGKAPVLFRPPYGNYNTATLQAVKGCGPGAVVLWKETMQIHRLQYQSADHRLRPGDIILAHFRGPSELKGETMTRMFATLLRLIGQQGFAVARLDDYIAP
ncbi:polysaccharide deacetylase family protein [Streptacidiphilus griseoplanus]|uniref:polysaccharide deacetylase family protein n=1 Tax=Peterkaempfera griseoplana TaxID=66896 RepID=UPI0006E1D50D|nr:polysaccharide deacetylase family protein [Peterkaempfera griseoplana]